MQTCNGRADLAAAPTVKNLHTDLDVDVPQSDLDLSGLRCGSGSNLNNKKTKCKANNITTHSTGEDIVSYCRNLDGPVPHKVGIVENVTDTLGKSTGRDQEDSESDGEESGDLSIGAEWRTQLDVRGFKHSSRTVEAQNNGGPQWRKRYYEVDVESCPELGPH